MRRVLLALLAGVGGMMATVAAAAPERGYRVPNGHLPPPGECRVWHPDRPPGQQPPPTSCSQARRDAYRHGGRVVYGGDHRHDRFHDADRRDKRYERRDDSHAGAGGIFRDPELRDWAYRNFDRNRDGRIGRAELDEANIAFFRYADRNRDGRLSVSEYNAARMRLRG